jgi:ADP-heptose:LPS heptosyltransferase
MIPSGEQFLYFFSSILSDIQNLGKNASKFTPRSILIVKLDEIGDMATATHVFEHLKTRYPNSSITLLCKPFVKNLIANDPNVDEIIISESEWKKKYDLVVELRGNWKTLFKAIRFWPKMRGDRGSVRWRNKKLGGQVHEVLTNYQIIEPLLDSDSLVPPQIHLSQEDEDYANSFIQETGIDKFALIHAGARRELRRWDLSNYAELCTYLRENHKLSIVLVGGEEDEIINEKIQSLCTYNLHSIAGKNSLTQFAALAKKASLFVGNESGPIHIAAAMNTPLIGIYGPGVADIFYPYGDNSRVLHKILECNPCDQINCKYPDDPCINRVTLEEVKLTTSELLN